MMPHDSLLLMAHRLYLCDDPTGESERRAIELYERAAESGSAAAANLIARHVNVVGNQTTGATFEERMDLCIRMELVAATFGSAEGMAMVGLRMLFDEGDAAEAERVLKLAAEQGDPTARALLEQFGKSDEA